MKRKWFGRKRSKTWKPNQNRAIDPEKEEKEKIVYVRETK